MSLTALREAIDDLVEHAASFCDAESVVACHHELTRLDAFVTKVTAGLDASGEWTLVGARNCASYVATETHLPMREARRRINLGRKLREMPCTAEAFEDGDISQAHAEALSGVRNPRTEKHFERDEPMLLSYARELRFAEFTRLLSYWEQHADPDGSDDAAEERRARRDVRLDSGYDGMFFGKTVLDPVSGSIVRAELDRLEQQLFESDWAEASERLGREPTLSELDRRPEQRRADALVEMATRSAAAPSDGRRPAPLFSVLIDFETLSGRVLELANGTVIHTQRSRCVADDCRHRARRLHPRGAGRGEPDEPAVHRGDATGHRATGPALHPPVLRGAARTVRGRPHRPLRRGWPHHTGERAAPLRLPQPPQGEGATVGQVTFRSASMSETLPTSSPERPTAGDLAL